MSIEMLYPVLVFGGLLAMLNGWGLVTTYRGMVDRVPGWAKHGSASRPRVFATGTIEAIGDLRPAPLTGRPCVAWRLAIVCRNTRTGAYRVTHDNYSDGHFDLVAGDARHHVRLESREHYFRVPRVFPRSTTSPWTLPRADSARDFIMEIHGGVAALRVDHGLSDAQAHLAYAAAAAAIERHTLPTLELNEELLLIETPVDVDTQWTCEGPRGPGGEIVTVPHTLDAALAPDSLKLAPVAQLRSIALRTFLREFSVFLFFDFVFVMLPALLIWADCSPSP